MIFKVTNVLYKNTFVKVSNLLLNLNFSSFSIVFKSNEIIPHNLFPLI